MHLCVAISAIRAKSLSTVLFNLFNSNNRFLMRIKIREDGINAQDQSLFKDSSQNMKVGI